MGWIVVGLAWPGLAWAFGLGWLGLGWLGLGCDGFVWIGLGRFNVGVERQVVDDHERDDIVADIASYPPPHPSQTLPPPLVGVAKVVWKQLHTNG